MLGLAIVVDAITVLVELNGRLRKHRTDGIADEILSSTCSEPVSSKTPKFSSPESATDSVTGKEEEASSTSISSASETKVAIAREYKI